MQNKHITINYSKINKLTRVTKVNGVIRYSFIPEPEYQSSELDHVPVPTIHFEGSKRDYIKGIKWLIQIEPTIRRYLSIPEQPRMTQKEMDRMNHLSLKLKYGPGLTPEEMKEYKSF